MQTDFVRTSIDLPRDLHLRLHDLAAQRGCSAEQLILQSIQSAVAPAAQQGPKKRLDLDTLALPLTGKPIRLTDDEIYAGLEFP